MANLLTRLNTYASLNNVTAEEKKYGAGIYVDFSDESDMYKQGTFKKVIDAVLEQALDSEESVYKEIVGDIKNYLNEQSSVKIFEVMVYDPKNDDFLRNITDEESKVMALEDSVGDYIITRDLNEGEEVSNVDYLDIVVNLKSPVGGK